jgi:hypothetical protein
MPLFVTITWLLTHLCFAIGLNWLAREVGVIHYGEVVSVYFILLAGKIYDDQRKFSRAYAENPELIETLMREELERNK